MSESNYRIVSCCFYCAAGCYRSGCIMCCIDAPDGTSERIREIGGVCDNFRWAEDNDRRLSRDVMPPEALAAIEAPGERARIKREKAKAEKLIAKCPIVKTGAPNNPCLKCEGREYCDIGRKAKV